MASSVTASLGSSSRTRLSRNQHHRREVLKRQLAAVAIENYQECQTWARTTPTDTPEHNPKSKETAEDIMRQLEQYCPVEKPVHEPRLLNARWSFVFSGVPTIGMKLITLLSRLSTALSIIEFDNVYLDVHDQQSRVKAVVRFAVFGLPMELNVHTALAPNHDDDDDGANGTHLWETFQCIALNGVCIPTPRSWQRSRDLEIRYIDEDMMIARTAGGEPHLLLRHSPCGTDTFLTSAEPDIIPAQSWQQEEQEKNEECDIENDLTEYFKAAQAKFGGQGLARSLVDRDYARLKEMEPNSKKASLSAAFTIPGLIQSILTGQDKH